MSTSNNDFNWIETLENFGFSEIKEFNYRIRGGTYLNFYTANYQNEQVFIKCGNGDYYVKKEYDGNNALYEQCPQHFVKGIMYKILDNNKMFLATSFVESEPLSRAFKHLDDYPINTVFDSIISIGFILHINKYMHRDIDPLNLIVEKNGNVRLIDFERFVSESSPIYEPKFEKSLKRILYTDDNYMKPNNYTWDDMYSIYKILEYFPKDKIRLYDYKMKFIKKLIGKNSYYFFDNKIPFELYIKYKKAILYKIRNELLKPFRSIL